jgi:hypothetical protein
MQFQLHSMLFPDYEKSYNQVKQMEMWNIS